MKFIVQPEVFDVLPNVCFGVVVAKGVNNNGQLPAVAERLALAIEDVRSRFPGTDSHDIPEIGVYRDTFHTLGYNPNKFMCSIEALVRRVLKGGNPPPINSVVDLGNAVSLTHLLPIGAHDIDASSDNIEVRYSRENDTFLPFGADEPESVAAGELVYARGTSIKTRRWIWRQGLPGMISETSENIFYPIDGFCDTNSSAILTARDELAVMLRETLGGKVTVGLVDAKNPEWNLD